MHRTDMRRWKFLKRLGIVSIIFIFIQLLIWIVFSSEQNENGLKSYSAKEVVRSIVEIWGNSSGPIFMIDPDILTELSVNKITKDHQTCAILCQTKKSSITMGVVGDNWIHHRFPLSIFRRYGFMAVDGTENWPDAKDNEIIPQVSTHIFLQHPSYQEPTVHLVVFYERADGLWHSQIHMPVVDVKFGKTAGMFNKFKLQKVHVDGISFMVPYPVHEFLDEIPQSTFIECNKDRAKEFYTRYKKDTSNQALHFQRKARQLVARSKQILDSLGVPFWLSSGTLLGWFRQCDIIPYAQDVDFGVWIKDHRSDIVPAFENAGLSVKYVYGKVSDSFELSFQSGDVKLDIFFFYEESDHMWNGGTDAETAIKYKYSFPKFHLCWTIFLDLRVRVPCPTEPYIEANYGKKWFEQVKSWSWKDSPFNVKENGVWPKEEIETVIQIYE